MARITAPVATEAKQDVMQADLTRIEDIVGGDWEVAGSELIYYTPSPAHVELFRFDLTLDLAGEPIARTRTT